MKPKAKFRVFSRAMRKVRIRTRFIRRTAHNRAFNFVKRSSNASTPIQVHDVSDSPIEAPPVLQQIESSPITDLFGMILSTEIYPASPRFGNRSSASRSSTSRKTKSKKRKHRKGNVQYKILLRIRKTERVKEYRPKDNMDHRLVNDETMTWSREGLLKLHEVLLIESISNAKRCEDLDFNTRAEIWIWINRNDAEEPFSFIRCCEVSGVDPEIIRSSLKRLMQDNTIEVDMLRKSIIAAESGDFDAIQWCLSDATGPLTFTETCRAIGFDAHEARKDLRIPLYASAVIAA